MITTTPYLVPDHDAEREALDRRIAEEAGPVITYTVDELKQYGGPKEGAADMARPKGIDTAEVVRLVVDEGMTGADAGKRLGIDRAAVYGHLKKAEKAGQIEKVGTGKYRRVEAADEREQSPSDAGVQTALALIAKTDSRVDRHESRIVDLHKEVGDLSKTLTAMYDEHAQLTRSVETQALGADSELQKRLDGYAAQIGVLAKHVGKIEDRLQALEERVGYLERGQQFTAEGAVPLSNHDHVARLMDMLDRLLERGAA